MKQLEKSGRQLLWQGPTLAGEVHPSELSFLSIKNGHSATPFWPVRLLIDTGSNISGLDASIVQHLKLPLYQGTTHVEGVGGMHEVKKYRCVLFLEVFGKKGLPLDVVAGQYQNSPYDGIIGRDVLQYCKFIFDGPANQFHLEAIDF
jgi:hypothetical protein